jgi:hypothetical protein
MKAVVKEAVVARRRTAETDAGAPWAVKEKRKAAEGRMTAGTPKKTAAESGTGSRS